VCKLYRSSDGSEVGVLDNTYFTPALTKGYGGSTVAFGLVDRHSRKCMPWSIKALIHLSMGKLHLFQEDLFLRKPETNRDDVIENSPVRVLG
jgi:hypothetical protein